MKKTLLAVIIAAMVAGAMAKPQQDTNVAKAEKSKQVSDTLGDYDALTNAIITAKKVDDLKPVLLKMLDATATTADVKKKKTEN